MRYFDIDLDVRNDPQIRKKGKGSEDVNAQKKIITSMKWAIKEGVDINARSGIYFLRSTFKDAESKHNVWQF